MAGLNAGRLARRILSSALEIGNPQGDYETEIRTPVYQLMEGLLLYNEVGIKQSRARYQTEVNNDYWRCSAINMEEVLRVFQEAMKVSVNNKKDMWNFLNEQVVQNKNSIASTRNPKRGIAQAIVEMWRKMGSTYEAAEVVPEITEEGVKSLRPLLQLYNYRNHPYERRRLHDSFYDLFESFHPGETLTRPPLLREGDPLLDAIQGKVEGILPDKLRESLEGRSETSLKSLEQEIQRLQGLRQITDDPQSPDILWQTEIIKRIVTSLREGNEIRDVEHNPFSKPPYENAVLLRLNSPSVASPKYHQVYLRVDGGQVMTRLTNLGMLLRSFEVGSQIKVVLLVEGAMEMANQLELTNTIQRIIGAFAHSQKERIEVELSLRTRRGQQSIKLTPTEGARPDVDGSYFEALTPLVEKLRLSGSDRTSPQSVRNEGALPSRLLDNLLKRSRVWPMLLDYVGGPINQGVRSALTRPERSSFIGVYSGGKLVEVFAVYRDSDNRPMVLSHSLTSRMAKAEPRQHPDLSSVDFFDGQPLGEFLEEYESYAQTLNLTGLQYRVLSLRSLPLEEALVGQIEGVNPVVLWRFLRAPSPEREEMLERITPLYEKSMTQARDSFLQILKTYLVPFFLTHQAEIESDPTYQLLERYGQELKVGTSGVDSK
jgi:hypothetical protein